MGRERRHVIVRFLATFFSRRVVARRRRRFCCAVAASFIALAVFLFITDKWNGMMTSSARLALVHTSDIAKPTKGCKLPKLDPLDASILEYVDPTYRPMANCNVTFVPKTRIRNGRIELIPELSNGTIGCEFRCHYPKDDYHVRLGQWLDISKTPDCDVVEVRCRDDSNVFYEYVHTQIFIPRPAVETVEATPASRERGRILTRPPDVHLFILDSVSSPQFMRSMPKSLRFLEEEMGAINFRHVSKVADNSRPNAYALFFGKRPLTEDEWDYCEKPLDDEPFVGFEFKRRGYKTMIAEDWALSALMWPSCKAFNRTPVDHYMHPLQLLYDRTSPNNARTADHMKWRNKLFNGQCRGMHLYVLDYLKNFLDSYRDEPKFSLTWMTELAHDNANGLYEMDEPFLRFLEQYKEKLNNAFFFVMGDHGSRIGDIRKTKQGEMEDKNPVTILTVPEHLRKNRKLMANVEANSRHLMTHHDTHATLVSIAREGARQTTDSSFDHLDTSTWNVTLLGESYLYPFNLTVPRTCQNQRVPLEYCICQNRVKNVTDEKRPLARRIAAFVVRTINDFLRNQSALVVCSKLSHDRSSTATLFHLLDEEVHQITLKTLPNHGWYDTHVKVNESAHGGRGAFSIVAQRVARLDPYDAQSKCLDAYDVRPFCYCRNITSRGK